LAFSIFATNHEHDGDDNSPEATVGLNVFSGYSFSEGRKE
jgi:hypothetical protein